MAAPEDDEIVEDEENFQPDIASDEANYRLLRHEQQSNAKRLHEVENAQILMKSVQDKLVNYAKTRQRNRRYYRYYAHVLCCEIYG